MEGCSGAKNLQVTQGRLRNAIKIIMEQRNKRNGQQEQECMLNNVSDLCLQLE